MSKKSYPNSGSLWKNTKNDKSDVTGSLMIGDERDHWLNGWYEGKEFIRLGMKRKDAKVANETHGELKKVESTGNQPQWRGFVKNAAGERFELSGWRKEYGKEVFLSIKVSQNQSQAASNDDQGASDDDSDGGF